MGLCVVEKEGCGLHKVKVYLKVVVRIIKVHSLRSIIVLSQFASNLPTTIGNINYKVREFQKNGLQKVLTIWNVYTNVAKCKTNLPKI